MAILGNLVDKLGSKLKLPEFGLSERLAKGKATTNTFTPATRDIRVTEGNRDEYAQAVGSRQSSGPSPSNTFNASLQNVPQSQAGAGGASFTLGTGFSGSAGVGAPQGGNAYGPAPTDPIAQNVPSEMDMINQQFEQELAQLGLQESQIGNQFNQSTGFLNEQNQNAMSQLTAEEANRRGGVEQNYQQASQGVAQQSAQQEQQLRQLVGELQQRNSARFGGSSSSLADASNDMVSSKALQGLSTVQNNRANAQQSIEGQKNQQISALSDFFTKSRNNLATTYQQSLQEITADRDQRLAAIQQSKGQAASSKSSASFQAWQNYLANKRQVDADAARSAQALQEFAAKKAAQLQNKASTTQFYTPQFDPINGSFMGAFNKNTGTFQPGGNQPQGDQGGSLYGADLSGLSDEEMLGVAQN